MSLVAQLGSLSIPFVGLKFLARARDGAADETRRIHDALVMLLVMASIAFLFLRPDERRWILRLWQAPAAARPR
ncbi:MAG: hypothetical protein ACR2OG_06835 [Gemmatimonadaceae bacterium]